MRDGRCKVGNDLGKNKEGTRASGMCPSQLILCLVAHSDIHTHTLMYSLSHTHTLTHSHRCIPTGLESWQDS